MCLPVKPDQQWFPARMLITGRTNGRSASFSACIHGQSSGSLSSETVFTRPWQSLAHSLYQPQTGCGRRILLTSKGRPALIRESLSASLPTVWQTVRVRSLWFAAKTWPRYWNSTPCESGSAARCRNGRYSVRGGLKAQYGLIRSCVEHPAGPYDALELCKEVGNGSTLLAPFWRQNG